MPVAPATNQSEIKENVTEEKLEQEDTMVSANYNENT